MSARPRIHGDGTPEPDWQAWPGIARIHRTTLDRLVAPGGRLVVVAPHPDDEILACGGLLALHAARGGALAIVALTDGEASHPELAPSALAARRREERLEGLRHLGATDAPMERLGLPDGGIAGHVEHLRRRLPCLLRRDDTVVCTWRHDGHPDHEAAGRCVAEACAGVGARVLEAPVWMWHWAQPGDARVPWDRLVALPLPPSVRLRKRSALRSHASQFVPRSDGSGPVLGAAIGERAARAHEYFFHD